MAAAGPPPAWRTCSRPTRGRGSGRAGWRRAGASRAFRAGLIAAGLAALIVVFGLRSPAFTIGIVIFVVALLVSIMLHEAGHFAAAKAFGMQVTKFFVGFGATLW